MRIEAGTANPTIDTLYAVAGALDVPMGTLLESSAAERIRVVRKGERLRIEGAIAAELVDRVLEARLAEILLMRFAARRRRVADPHPAGVTEHLLVWSGILEAGPVGETVELYPGDYIAFPADVPHSYLAPGKAAEAIAFVTYP